MLTIAEPIFQHRVYLTTVVRIARTQTDILPFSQIHKPAVATVKKSANCRAIFDIDPNLAERLTGKRREFVMEVHYRCYLCSIAVDRETERQRQIPLPVTAAPFLIS